MSRKYKDAMDKVTASDELKEKILLAAGQKLSENKNTVKKSKVHYFVRYAAAAAASDVYKRQIMNFAFFDGVFIFRKLLPGC